MFNFGNFWNALQSATSHLSTLASAIPASIHDIEATQPIVSTAISLTEAEFPGFAALVGIADTVLANTRTTANALQQAVAALAPKG